jgi:glucose-1-phosphate cytidylyltransferase
MVEIGGRPILWHIMKHLSTYGIREFVIAVGYKGEMIKDYFLNYETRSNDFTVRLGNRGSITIHGGHDESDWEVTIADTGPETFTGGRIRKAMKYLTNERFLVAYGDGLSDVNIHKLLQAHDAQQKLATITITQPPSRYGVVDLDGDRVTAFQEKPRLDGWVNIGYFVFEPEVLEYIVDEGPLEVAPLSALARDEELGSFRHSGFWQPMDTYREVELLNRLWISGQTPWLR